jgi:hypothetical protein
MALTAKISSVLKMTEFPFLLVLLFSITGWLFTKLSDKITSAPTIEYELIRESSPEFGLKQFKYRLTNLSSNKQFKNLSFLIVIPENEWGRFDIKSGTLVNIPPAASYADTVFINPPRFALQFTIKHLNPLNQYDLVVNYNGKISNPVFTLIDNQPDKEISSDSLILKPASIFTFLVKNELYIYTALFIFFLLIIFLYLYNVLNIRQ